MGHSRTERAQVAERRRQNIELRIQGKSWEQIAQALGYKTRGAACQDFGRALDRLLEQERQAAEQLRALELERLDALQRKVWEIMERPHLLVQGGHPVTVTTEDGRSIRLQDDGPVLAAVDRLLRISERRARLLGIEAPEQIEHAGTVQFEFPGVDMAKAFPKGEA